MTANTHSTAVKKAINIVETMNGKDRYKTLVREREEARINEALAIGATYRYGVEQGAKDARLETARAYLKLGVNPDQVSIGSGIPLEIVLKIFSENQT